MLVIVRPFIISHGKRTFFKKSTKSVMFENKCKKKMCHHSLSIFTYVDFLNLFSVRPF
jgi:hypothetical protein